MTARGQVTKKYLYTIRREHDEIEHEQLKLESLYGSLIPGAIRYDKDKVQTSLLDQMFEKMPEITAMEEEISRKIGRLMNRKLKVQRAIDDLQDPRERIILSMFFLEKKQVGANLWRWRKLDEIAQELFISESTAFRSYESALNNLQNYR